MTFIARKSSLGIIIVSIGKLCLGNYLVMKKYFCGTKFIQVYSRVESIFIEADFLYKHI